MKSKIFFLVKKSSVSQDSDMKLKVSLWVSPFEVLGLGVLAGLGLSLGVTALPSGEPAGLVFFEAGGPRAD